MINLYNKQIEHKYHTHTHTNNRPLNHYDDDHQDEQQQQSSSALSSF